LSFPEPVRLNLFAAARLVFIFAISSPFFLCLLLHVSLYLFLVGVNVM
jgi:hypothetical protein